MLGQVVNITKFGAFVTFSEKNGSLIAEKIGLLRWSAIPKRTPKIQIHDFIGIEIEKVHDNGKIDLKFVEKDFKQTFGYFLNESLKQLELLKDKNKETFRK